MTVARRRLVAAVAVAFLAGIYAVAFVLLWRSSIPGDLRLPSPDVREYFGPAELEKARDYQLFVRINFVLSQVALIVVLGLYAVFGPRFARESAAGRIGTGMLLGMIGLAFLWLVHPDVMRNFFTSHGGQVALLVASLMVAAGSIVIQRIVDIDV